MTDQDQIITRDRPQDQIITRGRPQDQWRWPKNEEIGFRILEQAVIVYQQPTFFG